MSEKDIHEYTSIRQYS